ETHAIFERCRRRPSFVRAEMTLTKSTGEDVMSARSGFLVTAAMGCLIAGCASDVERPTAAMTRAETLISEAEKGDAQRYAAVELQQAREKLRRADEASDNDDNV